MQLSVVAVLLVCLVDARLHLRNWSIFRLSRLLYSIVLLALARVAVFVP